MHTKPPGSAWVGPLQCAGFGIGEQLDRPAGAIVSKNPRSLWTPLLWGRGRTTRSCTVCTITLHLQRRRPLLHAGGCVWGFTIYRNEFPELAEEQRPMEKHLQFELQRWTSVSNVNTDTNTYSTNWASTTAQLAMSPCVCKGNQRSTLPLCLSRGSQHCHGEESPISIPTQTHLCISKHTLDYSSICNCTTGYDHLCLKWETKINTSTLFVKRKVTSPRRSLSNSDPDTDSRTHDLDREAAYGNQWCSSCNHDTTGLCVTFGGVVDWKSRELNPAAESTTEFWHRPMFDASKGISGCLGGAQSMAWFGFCLLSSVFCLLSSVGFCLFFQWLTVWRTW